MFKSKFTDKEWETILFTPLWAFTLVAGADGKVEDAETAVLAKELAEASLYKDEFVREVLSAIVASLEKIMIAYGKDSRLALAGLMEAATLLDEKLPAGGADSFKRVVLGICLQTAQSTGRGKNKVSKEEEKALVMVAASLRVPLS